ncbi:hypothetical protein S1361_00845 [Streptomyces cyanogenus]|uniref:Uncharacterized protein n=1 Tax=Streptomyces cyanogenus TaxID=80860 RepID=A0ABX7TK61_STRCY|nr:hypothetical protein S1361_00845 [Streptomyces cyanogenus]
MPRSLPQGLSVRCRAAARAAPESSRRPACTRPCGRPGGAAGTELVSGASYGLHMGITSAWSISAHDDDFISALAPRLLPLGTLVPGASAGLPDLVEAFRSGLPEGGGRLGPFPRADRFRGARAEDVRRPAARRGLLTAHGCVGPKEPPAPDPARPRGPPPASLRPSAALPKPPSPPHSRPPPCSWPGSRCASCCQGAAPTRSSSAVLPHRTRTADSAATARAPRGRSPGNGRGRRAVPSPPPS